MILTVLKKCCRVSTKSYIKRLSNGGGTILTEEKQAWLQRPFEEEEITECLNMCAMEKTPGPDGLPIVFFKTFWDTLKDIIGTANFFHSFEKIFNATFIALIPKKPGAI